MRFHISLAGVFFGPIAGALCAAIGGFIGPRDDSLDAELPMEE